MKTTMWICILFCTITTLEAQIPFYIPTNGLAGWWPFNGNANDESGNGNNGTPINGAGLSTDRYQVSNKAYNFDGVNDYIRLSGRLLNGSSSVANVTFACWMLADGTLYSASWQILGLSGQYPSPQIITGKSPEYFVYSFGRDLVLNDTSFIDLGNWQHVVFTFDNGVWSVYKNGVKYADRIESPQTLNFSYETRNGVAPYVWFGAYRQGNLNPGKVFDGKLDDIAIWNRTLTSWEIQNMYLQSCNTCEFPDYQSTSTNCNTSPKKIPF